MAAGRYPQPMPDDDLRIEETNAIVAELERAGLVTVPPREDGEPVYTLTSKGIQVANQMSLSDEDEAAVLLDALLEVRED